MPAHSALGQTTSLCLHFCIQQNSLPEKVEVIRTGRPYINLHCAGRFSPEIVWPKGKCACTFKPYLTVCLLYYSTQPTYSYIFCHLRVCTTVHSLHVLGIARVSEECQVTKRLGEDVVRPGHPHRGQITIQLGRVDLDRKLQLFHHEVTRLCAQKGYSLSIVWRMNRHNILPR